MLTPGLDAGGVTPELNLRLESYCSWIQIFCFFVCLFLVCLLISPHWFLWIFVVVSFVIVGFVFLFLLLLPFFLFLHYQLYHHHPLIPTVTPFTLHPSPVLKPIAPLSNNSFCLFSPTLYPQPSPSLAILLQPVTRLPFPPSHSSLTEQPTIPTLHNPKSLQSLTQTPSSTTTEIYPNTHKNHKNSYPHTTFPTHPPHFPSPPL
jgi:hypothetical protein